MVTEQSYNTKIILVHGISDQQDDWYVEPSKLLSKYGEVIPFRWDYILNKSIANRVMKGLNTLSKIIIATKIGFLASLVNPMLDATLDRAGDVLGYSSVFNEAYTLFSAKLEQVAVRDEDGNFPKIIVVGHSMGSVLAFQTLKKLSHELYDDIKKDSSDLRITLISLGSPLDREPVKSKVIKRLEQDAPTTLDKVLWVNVWGTKDPVVSWTPSKGDMKTFKPDHQIKVIGIGHDLVKYLQALIVLGEEWLK